jgi:hypothetical protein
VAATVAADGTYSATIPAASLPAQDGPFAVNVATTDAAGNTATATQTLTLDRGTTVAITGVEGGDNTINAAEAADGIVITGTAEAGSTVTVNVSRPLWPPRHLHRHPAGSDARTARSLLTVTARMQPATPRPTPAL